MTTINPQGFGAGKRRVRAAELPPTDCPECGRPLSYVRWFIGGFQGECFDHGEASLRTAGPVTLRP